MRIFKYWVKQHRAEQVNGIALDGQIYGGSNQSEAAAFLDVERRWRAVVERARRGRNVGAETYEADIREEVVEWISEDAVVTRNRYGAEILNSKTAVFVDIDEWPRGILERIFYKKPSNEERTNKIVQHMRKIFELGQHPILGARLYETPRGVRAILNIQPNDPRSEEVQKIMQALKCDYLYQCLCLKQNCYRARLTPKPRRLGIKSLNQGWPVSEPEQQVRAEWVQTYGKQRENWAACRFIKDLGDMPASAVMDYHDQASGAFSGKAIA